ncbi:MAG TPA: hypothetical protein VLQ93_16320 [Myxococcaceae bacterium]|nr:hypothetical protein [Myxococcaceae bacterium]
MAHKLDVEEWQSELVKALKYGKEEQARALVYKAEYAGHFFVLKFFQPTTYPVT